MMGAILTVIGTLIESAMEQLVLELKESIGLPFRVDQMPGAFTIKTPYPGPSHTKPLMSGKSTPHE